MSVRTTADEKIDEAKDKIKEAYKLLLEAVSDDTWGSEDLRSDYIDTMHEVIAELAKLRRKL